MIWWWICCLTQSNHSPMEHRCDISIVWRDNILFLVEMNFCTLIFCSLYGNLLTNWRCWSCYNTFISSDEEKSIDLIIPKTQQLKPCSLQDSNLNDQPEKTDVWTRLEESLLNRGLWHVAEFSPQTDKEPVKHQDEMGTDVSLWYLLMGQSGQQEEEHKVR